MISSASKPNLCGAIFDAPKKKTQLDELEKLIGDPEFWNNPEKSQEVMQKRKRLGETVDQDRRISTMSSDVAALIELGREGEDVHDLLNTEVSTFRNALSQLETGMLLSDEHDHLSAILNIHPGAGGTESQDWAEMLMRMYLRWAERKNFKATITDQLDGDGAGIKSVTIEVEGDNAYGLMSSEIGVHRLVRISPFDANARRHTSFASVYVYPLIDDEIKIEIKPEDVRTDVFRASGAGGQHVNRTESAVRMTHIPTGIVVQCQNERSQHKNRASALKQLKARLFEHELEKRRIEDKKSEDSKLEINFGSQIRSYVLAPYRMIKDHRTKLSVGDVDRALDGDIDPFIHAWLVYKKTGKIASDAKDEMPD